ERGVLVAGGGLDRGDDLAGDAELGEVPEARLPIGPVVPDRLVQPHQPLLDQVVAVTAGQEVRRRLQAHESVVATNDRVVRHRVPLLGERDQIAILNLKLRVGVRRKPSHECPFPTPADTAEGPKSWRTPPGGAEYGYDRGAKPNLKLYSTLILPAAGLHRTARMSSGSGG